MVDVELQYNRKISDFERGTEQISNGIGFIPAIGTAWGFGWEIGRNITNVPTYRHWKRDTWFPLRKEFLGY